MPRSTNLADQFAIGRTTVIDRDESTGNRLRVGFATMHGVIPCVRGACSFAALSGWLRQHHTLRESLHRKVTEGWIQGRSDRFLLDRSSPIGILAVVGSRTVAMGYLQRGKLWARDRVTSAGGRTKAQRLVRFFRVSGSDASRRRLAAVPIPWQLIRCRVAPFYLRSEPKGDSADSEQSLMAPGR